MAVIQLNKGALTQAEPTVGVLGKHTTLLGINSRIWACGLRTDSNPKPSCVITFLFQRQTLPPYRSGRPGDHVSSNMACLMAEPAELEEDGKQERSTSLSKHSLLGHKGPTANNPAQSISLVALHSISSG
jgi:hypothetical protein